MITSQIAITAEQAHIIFDVYREFGIGTQWFDPKAVYPTWMKEAARTILGDLFDAGLVERKNGGARFRLTERALDAYDRWAHTDRFDRLRRVHYRSCNGGTCSVEIVVTGPIEQARLERVLSQDPDYMGISMV